VSAYPEALRIDSGAAPERLRLAAEALWESSRVVLLDDSVALHSSPRELVCEVIEPAGEAHRCAEEYKVMVENAARALEASPLAALLPERPRQWRVMESDGTRVNEVWRAER
jgi:hypothetical protein